MRSTRGGVLLAGLCGLVLFGLPTTSSAHEPSPAAETLRARSSSAAGAMEYWDVNAWLESGDRFFARFLVTNQGPGEGTAAAVGHLVLASGEVLPFKWGRRHDAWTLGPGGRSLAIAKAKLDLDGPTVVVEVDSAKRGIELRLEIARNGPLVMTRPPTVTYAIAVAMPAAAHGRLRTRGMDAARPLIGSGSVTHTWMERPEGELLDRRLELWARTGDVAVYLSDLTLADGSHHGTAVASRDAVVWARADNATLSFGKTTTGGDPRYPLATMWEVASPTLTAHMTVDRELLRMNPLDILPQPFRMLLALRGQPERVWANAHVDLRVTPTGPENAGQTRASGIAAATFAR